MALKILFKKIWNIVGICVNLFDMVTDIMAACKHYNKRDRDYGYLYFYLTILFMIPSVLLSTIACIQDIIQDIERPVLTKCLLVPVVICCAPLIPAYYLMKSAIATVKGDDADGHIADRAARIKLIEALLEAIPQATLLLFIGVEEPWQWLSLVTSLFSLSFTVASSTYLYKNATTTTRVAFFFFGLMAATSRIMACSFYFIMAYFISILAFLPLVSLYTASITVWFIKTLFYCCRGCCVCCVPLAGVHRRCDVWGLIHVILSWNLTAIYNCFTLTGLLISTINLAWTFLPLYRAFFTTIGSSFDILITTFSIATFLINFILVIIPRFRHSIGKQWLNNDECGGTRLF